MTPGPSPSPPTRSAEQPAATRAVGPALDRDQFLLAVRAAIRAPSMHNAQPWRFGLVDGCLQVRADPSRQLPVADPHGWAVRVACGAAAANAQLALALAGVPTVLLLYPEPGDSGLVARLDPDTTRPPTPSQIALARAIPDRHSNRNPFADVPVPADSRTALRTAATAQGASLGMLVGHRPLEIVAAIVRSAEQALQQDAAYLAEMRQWSSRGQGADDGIPTDVAGVQPMPQDLLPMRGFGGAARGHLVDFEAEPLVGVLCTAGDTSHDHVLAGVALEHVLLTATVHGLATSLLSQPIEVPAARDQLRRGLGGGGVPQLVLRIGFGQPSFASPRRPVEDVIDD